MGCGVCHPTANRSSTMTASAEPSTPSSANATPFWPVSPSRRSASPTCPAKPSTSTPPTCISAAGHGAEDVKLVQVGVCAVVDDLGALPLFGHVLDGNSNGHTAIDQSYALLSHYLPLPPAFLMVSDRGTFSASHVARLHRHGHAVLCSVPWQDYRALFDQHRSQLHWRRASYLSQEQQRRRDTPSTLPHEHYDLAVVRHQLLDPETQQDIPCRVVFVFSRGLEQVAATVQRGHPGTTPASINRRVTKLLGTKGAAQYFRWELLALRPAEQAALPPPGSADQLFSQFKQQNYVELLHHQWKTPLAVRPVFLKSPRRQLVYYGDAAAYTAGKALPPKCRPRGSACRAA